MSSEEKISFWKTPEGKILSHGIHEHNSGLGILQNYIKWFEYSLKNNIEHSKEEQLKVLDSMKNAKTKCSESMDYVYEEIKKLKGY